VILGLSSVLLIAGACADPEPQPTSSVATLPVALGPGTTGPLSVGGGEAPPPTAEPLVGLDAETVVRTLENPVFVTALPGDGRLFVLEKEGEIRIVRNGELEDDPFLDLEAFVDASGLEQGLLGMAFHPRFPEDDRFFVSYTDVAGVSVIAEFRMSGDPDRADPDSLRILLSQSQPETNHNGGMVAFGPDGYLWVGFGDGGGAGDPGRNGQNANTLLGTILRLDVDGGDPYAVPPDNPFVAGGGDPRVWAYGLRNPWRFSVDTVDGYLYIADVGQDGWEEIDVVPWDAPGLNFGWSRFEGDECLREPCDFDETVRPVLSYDHAEGCSVIGGLVYRGSAIPELWGHYLYGDWCGRWVRSFRFDGGEAVDLSDWTAQLGQIGQIQSFGQGGDGEVYFVTADGFLLQVVPRR
jgi:glucose/arabinose dehydrogenase